MILPNLRASFWKIATAVCAVLAVAALLAWAFSRAGAAVDRARADAAETRAAELAQKLENTQRILATERASARAMDEVAARYEQEKLDAKASQDRVVADLRDGNLRLHKLWQAERATDQLADSLTAARHLDELTQLREEAAGRIIGVGAEADAHVRGLQEVIRRDRELLKQQGVIK